MYRFAALFGDSLTANENQIGESLRAAGLTDVLTHARFSLYVSADTPVTRLHARALLVGHAFRRADGTPLTGSTHSEIPADIKLTRYLIEQCWGDYIVLEFPADDWAQFDTIRDPSGGVACVYSIASGCVTSDVSAMVDAGVIRRAVDWSFIKENLIYPHLKTGSTGLLDVSELLPGHRLRISGDAATTDELWTPWTFATRDQRYRSAPEAAAAVRSSVTAAVESWAAADGDVLLELSGGLDSSIVAACLRHSTARVTCCNLVTAVPGADERDYATAMSGVLGQYLHVRTLRVEDAAFDFPPPANAVAPSTWFLQNAANTLKEAIGQEQGIRSFFSGGGGDTAFGYIKTAAPAADAYRERGLLAAACAARDLAELHQCTFWKACRLTIKKLLSPPKPPRVPDLSFVRDTAHRSAISLHPWFASPPDSLPGDRERIFDLAGAQIFRDGVARATTSHLRMPLLSQPVVEACLKVPSWMWIEGGYNRSVARSAFADDLPAKILHRRSKGTFMNYSGAVYRRNKPLLRDYLLQGSLEGHGLLDATALQRFFDRRHDDLDDGFMRIFDLCAIENWVRHQT
ncbi:asparagine synthetase B family protein [Luteimonas fraxinea]|uniref:asparagine synthase-related protein n=1 Tax=Luteimonas fraxinea TaxID=2901869 RepID=UPI0022B7AFE5|nr:asparagine synthetase B family protein [Luteimonas fraxinea]